MELGLGKLGWNPEVFWRSTMMELNAGAIGLAKFHGNYEEENETAPLSRKEMEKLKEKLGA